MQSKFLEHINQLIPNLTNKQVFVAVSGGIDSMVLLELCHVSNLNPVALHCNFNLRGNDSLLDEKFVKDNCLSKGITLHATQFETTTIAIREKISIQECARNLRYDWFQTFLDKNDNSILFTGHHLDDSIETFFINILRGTGIKGLTGIRPQRNRIYRPLLQSTKEDILLYSIKHDVSFREDKSNKNTKYTRNEVRHKLIPNLQEMTKMFDSKLITLMADLKDIDDFIDRQTLIACNSIVKKELDSARLDICALKKLDTPIFGRILSIYGLQRSQLNEIRKLIEGRTGAIFKNTQYTFLKDRTDLIIKENTIEEKVEVYVRKIPTLLKVKAVKLKFSEVDKKDVSFGGNIAFVDKEKLTLPLMITNNYAKGLRFQPLGMKGTKLVSDVLSEAKLNQFEKKNQLFIFSGTDLVWILGIKNSQKTAISEDTKTIIKIELLE